MAETETRYQVTLQFYPNDKENIVDCRSQEEVSLLRDSVAVFKKGFGDEHLDDSETAILEKASPILADYGFGGASREYDHQVRLSRGQ